MLEESQKPVNQPYAVNYAKALSEEAEIDNVPPVLLAIIIDSVKNSRAEPTEFRKYKYIIIDDETFTKIKCETFC